VFFDCSLQEGSVDGLVFLETDAVLADEHAGHVARLLWVFRLVALD
jgi:hypothetical protein